MARIRTIKPEFWKHEELSGLPEATHMLAAALLNYADDEGYFNANPKLIQSECCPLRDPSVSIQDSLTALASIGYLQLGKTAEGKLYGQIVHFTDHQRVNRPIASKIKGLAIEWGASRMPHPQLTEHSPPEWNGKEEEGKGRARETRASRLPDDWEPNEEAIQYALSRGVPRDKIPDEVEAFRDHWHNKSGKDGLKRDWSGAWRTWVKRTCEWRGYKPPSPMAQGGASVWMPNHDERFAPLRERWTKERGKPPPEIGSNGNPGVGWHFPAAWVTEIPASLKRTPEVA